MQKGTEQNPNDPIIVYNAACFYSLLDDKKAAVENLKKAIEIGFEKEVYNYVKHDPDLACLQNEPDFIELMKDKG